MILLVTQLVGNVLSIMAVLYQRRYNKLHKSVYGLSYDSAVLTIARLSVDLYTSLNYKFNIYVRTQLYARFPLFYKDWDDIPISISLLITNVGLLIAYLSIWKQLTLYKATSHTHQGVSMICIATLVVFLGITGTATFYLYYFNAHHFMYLDHLNILWIMGNMIGMVTLCPQICINWMGRCCSGISSRYILTLFVADCIRWIGYVVSAMKGSVEYWNWPFNSIPIVTTSAELLGLSVILYQAQVVYIGHKPTLPRIHEKRTALV
ncbi:similar to Saccharomyces cerevisiae YCL002C Putative protein of unknown function [Maudiozyma saulgeensis]|uniref:Uncharacterized protein n=1 Tax=Maudiozyma saulgeensis TaxID=1789683 RepID=A0A1X7R8Y7_9SACH|nr:similar to Saccharomyces cerevisiae YCL002C Putative protein of unknown function [Kazachstania saulgeensis]